MDDVKGNISFFKKTIGVEYVTLCFLLIISAMFRAPVIFQGFAMWDAACIAVSIIDFINHGQDGNFTNLYFLDVIPGYYLYIKLFMKLLDNNYAYLTTVINYTNVITGSLIIIPCYYFVKRLFNNKSIAFFTTLAFIFSPVIFRHSIFGMPPLLPLFFFITSLYLFLLWLDRAEHVFLLLSFLTLTVTIFFKSVFVLGSGAYLGLLFLRGAKEKEKIVLTVCIIAFSVISFWLLRQWTIGHQYTGPDLGSTTSISNFIKWGERFIVPLYVHFSNRNYVLIFQTQVRPIINAIGVISFIASAVAFMYYLIKKRFDILLFVISWSAVPTVLWLIVYPSSQQHNMLSVLPFLIILFLFIHEKIPKFIALVLIIFVAGNFLLTSSAPAKTITGIKLFDEQLQTRRQVNDVHSLAKRIAQLEQEKIVFATPSLKPYLLYELFISMPGYNTEKFDDYCYKIGNEQCIVCFNVSPEEMVLLIKNNHLESYTIIAPSLNLHFLKEEGLKVIDNSNIQSLTGYDRSLSQSKTSA